MVCKNEEQHAAILWDDKTIYGFVVEPTEYQKKLLNAVNKLPITFRKVVILYAFEGMQRRKIASIMRTSLASIRFLIYQSGVLLQENLTDAVKQDVTMRIFGLNGMFSGWPYVEYAGLVELRKNVVFVE